MTVTFLPFELNLAVIILEEIGSHCMRALVAVGDIMMATPSVCSWLSSGWPEKITVSPVGSWHLPVPFHLLSQIPNTSILYLLISAAIWAAFPVSYIVRTFQVPILTFAFIERRHIG
uniref:Uncharacterized protein n=1 Tax=Trichobilharzia regenti TaxID=157069 RepID=A0AA85IUG4_TRIRE|nr:unnamed protein product [Trichobilharzia regenti]